MNQNFILFSFICIILLSTSCNCKKSCCVIADNQGNWILLGPSGSSSPGGRTESVVFVIGNYAYMGAGLDNQNKRYNDFYCFDPSSLSWHQVATCAGMTPRNSAVSFVINGNGYVETGWDGYHTLSDFWQYNPSTNSWSQTASIGDSGKTSPRYNAVAFGIDNYGYVTTGNDGANLLKDFWQYDAASDTWKKKTDFPGAARDQAVSFVYNDKSYIVTGAGIDGTSVIDFYSFDPTKPDNLAWTELRHISNLSPDSYDDGYTSIVRYNAVGFVMLNTKSDGGGDRAYITTGAVGGSTTWAYNFATDLWNQKTSYAGQARQGAIGFTVQNRGFVGFGSTGSTCLSNLYEWKPDEQP